MVPPPPPAPPPAAPDAVPTTPAPETAPPPSTPAPPAASIPPPPPAPPASKPAEAEAETRAEAETTGSDDDRPTEPGATEPGAIEPTVADAAPTLPTSGPGDAVAATDPATGPATVVAGDHADDDAEIPAVTGSRINKLLALVAVVGVAVAIMMTILWLGERGDDGGSDEGAPAATLSADATRLDEQDAISGDAATERAGAEDAATGDSVFSESESSGAEAGDTAVSDEAAAAIDLDTDLEEALRAERAELEQVRAELTDARATIDAGADTADRLVAVEAESAELQAQLNLADATIAQLEGQLANGGVPADAVDLALAPSFAQWIGELLTSSDGDVSASPLDEFQAICMGGQVVGSLGLDGVGAAENTTATTGDQAALTDALGTAAETCGIDPAVVIG